ncbi:sensor histidine kinase [Clostridium sp. HBUAS56010]|uniref:sensor histidine kinase n=1 Tax=Clostridium sp. HBUAS56010 TaxID=2571127 RepID=UPI0011774938|nr:sensor histidine kinase [Clostridium sp. HBUAS56010]
MLNKFIPKTIRGKLMALTASLTLLITILTTSVCFSVFQSFLRKNQIQSAEFSLQVANNNIAADMKDIIYFSKWCCSNEAILDYLEAFKDESRLPTADKDTENLRPLALSTHNRLKEEYYNTRSNEYISRVIISSTNKNNFLQMSASANNSSGYAATIIKEQPFYSHLYESGDFLWEGMIEDPFSKISKDTFLPIVRPIYNKFNSKIIGWNYVEVSSKLFTDYLSSYPLAGDSVLLLTMGNKTYDFHSGRWEETQIPYKDPIPMSENESLSEGTRVFSATGEDGRKRIIVERQIDGMNGLHLSQILSEQQFQQQKKLYMLLILGICLIIVSLGILLTFLLNRIIMGPIRKLSNKIDKISGGDFSRDFTIEWDHELGQIGSGINQMSGNILHLLDKKLADEKQKKDLEYQILQSQINPHFLYNTLNSIKWMATIQNASGIADMTTALARLLKNVSKGTASLIPLREELALVKDYFLIQQYRYGGSVSIEYDIESEDLYECEIHRFSLQPIIENALFHGIEPTKTAGQIKVSAKTEGIAGEKILRVDITDNGVGMSEEMIRQVLCSDAGNDSRTEFFQHVGISNVNKRIQYDFGSEYGITITSKPGSFTTMTIRIPYVLHSDNQSAER